MHPVLLILSLLFLFLLLRNALDYSVLAENFRQLVNQTAQAISLWNRRIVEVDGTLNLTVWSNSTGNNSLDYE